MSLGDLHCVVAHAFVSVFWFSVECEELFALSDLMLLLARPRLFLGAPPPPTTATTGCHEIYEFVFYLVHHAICEIAAIKPQVLIARTCLFFSDRAVKRGWRLQMLKVLGQCLRAGRLPGEVFLKIGK